MRHRCRLLRLVRHLVWFYWMSRFLGFSALHIGFIVFIILRTIRLHPTVSLLGICFWREGRGNPGLAEYMGEKGG